MIKRATAPVTTPVEMAPSATAVENEVSYLLNSRYIEALFEHHYKACLAAVKCTGWSDTMSNVSIYKH